MIPRERAMEAWICLQDKREASSAAAPAVALPAEQMAAARVFGIMTEYLRAGERDTCCCAGWSIGSLSN